MVDTYKPMPFQDMAVQCVEDSKRWFPDVAEDLVHHVLSLAGEAGEVANMLKKAQRGSIDLNEAKHRHEFVMELTDVLIYLQNIAGILHVDLSIAYQFKRTENEKRFGNVTGG